MDDHSRRGTDHPVDLGAGNRGCEAFSRDQEKPPATAGCAGQRRVPATRSNAPICTTRFSTCFIPSSFVISGGGGPSLRLIPSSYVSKNNASVGAFTILADEPERLHHLVPSALQLVNRAIFREGIPMFFADSNRFVTQASPPLYVHDLPPARLFPQVHEAFHRRRPETFIVIIRVSK